MAAVLAYGGQAALSYRSAGGHWELRPDNRWAIDVSVPRPAVHSRRGIQAHVTATLTGTDVTIHDGIPCTTVARTLLDLSEVVDRRGLERAIDRAAMLRRFDLCAVEDVLARAGGRRAWACCEACLARGVTTA